MIYVLLPYYNEDTEEFAKSLESQIYKEFRVIRRDRKRDKIYWTKAMRDFQREVKRFCGELDSNVICVMNNDIEFSPNLFLIGANVRKGEVWIPFGNLVQINWRKKKFTDETCRCDGFYGRCFFMTIGDFKRFKFSRLLPHYLADLDFSLRVLRKLKPKIMAIKIKHKDHPRKEKKFILNAKNPIWWTIFLLKHPNKYTFKNILKAWL